ncbi:hypothetical protein D9M68_274250 [compost metagenome]
MSHMETADDLYRPASAELLEPQPSTPLPPALFDFSGRLSRARFLLWHFGLVVMLPWALLAAAWLASGKDWVAVTALFIAISPVNLLLSLSLFVRRARDLGLNAAWGVAAFALPFAGLLTLGAVALWPGLIGRGALIAALVLPALGNLLALFLAVWPGDRGTNRHGPVNTALGRAQQAILGALLVALLATMLVVVWQGPQALALVGEFRQWLQQIL